MLMLHIERAVLKPVMMAVALVGVLAFATVASQAADPLPSWNDGPAKQSIISVIERVTTPGSPDFVPVAERIATFDNDGTLWSEQPLPVQLYFVLDRVKALAPQHPEWNTTQPFASLLKGNLQTMFASGDHARLDVMVATHAGMTTAEFTQIVKDWIATARHPKTGQLFTDMTYQSILEVLSYLRANGFKNYIVSGGGIEFLRPWTERVYGVPPEQVVGSSIKTKFEMRDGQPVLVRLPELNFNDDKADKPVGINQHIGRRPLATFGNSSGDKEMLEYTQGGSGARFMLLVLHDDAAREYAYGPALGLSNPELGAFPQALYDQAKQQGWTVVSMKNDWKQVSPVVNTVTAIDILLNPDATMLGQSAADNASLLEAYPKGFALDASHHPHITMLQCFVRTADLGEVYAAVGGVLASANVNAMKLDATKRYYLPAGELGVAGIVVEPTAQLLKLQADIIAAVSPFTETTGSIGAFTAGHENPAIDTMMIDYVSTFVEEAAGKKFNPHVSTGTAPRADLDKLVAEPFTPFTFSPAGAAIYQLGPYGTAAKKLKEFDLKP
jgi:haloacid dehalogenase-like hydrolase